MKRGQFGTRTIWHRSEKGTIWHRDVIRIRNAISRLERNTLSNWKRNTFPTLRPKGAQTPSNCHISPKCWQNISNTNIFILLTHVSQPSARRAHRHPPTVIYPPNVGRKYPIQIYLFNWHICNIFVCLLRKMMVPNCPFYTAVPNCPGAKLSSFHCGAKLSLLHCGAKLSLFHGGAKLSLFHCGAKLS